MGDVLFWAAEVKNKEHSAFWGNPSEAHHRPHREKTKHLTTWRDSR